MVKPLNIVVIGLGYVGLTTAAALSYIGHYVTGIEKDENKLKLLLNKKSPIYEQGIEEIMKMTDNRIEFSNDLKADINKADVIIIAVGTPCKPNGQADSSQVEEAAYQISMNLEENKSYIIVIKSTVPIGTNRRVNNIIKRAIGERGLNGKIDVEIASNPEFLREGFALHDFIYPDRIVIGANGPGSVAKLQQLYQPILEQTFMPPQFLPRPASYKLPPFITTDPVSAEMIKYAANAFLATKISFINEIAGLCEKVGADIKEVARGIGLDSRIGPDFLKAGLGWGGSCFPKDTAALVAMGKELSYEMHLIEAVRKVNVLQVERAVEKLQNASRGVRGRIIGILGVAFKPGTDDVRESPSINLIKMLYERQAHIRAHDPKALENAKEVLRELEIEFYDDIYKMVEDADAIVIATEWPEYMSIDLEKMSRIMRTPVLLDGRLIFDPIKSKNCGFVYIGMGR